MKAFPFTAAEWEAVRAASSSVVNAALADDDVLEASHLVGLGDVLGDLRSRYGDHPVLVETEADFAADDDERIGLYRRATRVAVANGLPTLSIRLSLADLLIEIGKTVAAREELLACQGESTSGDESDRETWAELMAACGHDGEIPV